MADQLLLAPIRTDRPELTFRVRLDGTIYGMRLAYMRRHVDTVGVWMLDILSSTGAPIVLGIRVVEGIDLLGPYRSRNVPPGILRCVDTLGNDTDPTRQGLRGAQRLVYRPIEDIPPDDRDDSAITGGAPGGSGGVSADDQDEVAFPGGAPRR
jgi:hypothetical protein